MIGRSFDSKIAAALQRKDLLETLEALDRVAHDHKLREEDGERYRISMEAVRPVLLDELSRPRIKDVHGRIGTALERGVGRDMPLDDLSEHFHQAERAEKCVCFSLLAGQRALAERRWQGAREHF